MVSDGYQFIQERIISFTVHSINLNPSYNDQNEWGNSRGELETEMLSASFMN